MPLAQKMGIVIKSPQEVALMREAGRVVAAAIAAMAGEVRPGVATRELDIIAAREIARHGAIPSFKGYHGFPASCCVSVNDEVVHGIPGGRRLEEGDIVFAFGTRDQVEKLGRLIDSECG